jgi:hypothetical protein
MNATSRFSGLTSMVTDLLLTELMWIVAFGCANSKVLSRLLLMNLSLFYVVDTIRVCDVPLTPVGQAIYFPGNCWTGTYTSTA